MTANKHQQCICRNKHFDDVVSSALSFSVGNLQESVKLNKIQHPVLYRVAHQSKLPSMIWGSYEKFAHPQKHFCYNNDQPILVPRPSHAHEKNRESLVDLFDVIIEHNLNIIGQLFVKMIDI